eukprot:1851832-Amphidinium_carterae.1
MVVTAAQIDENIAVAHSSNNSYQKSIIGIHDFEGLLSHVMVKAAVAQNAMRRGIGINIALKVAGPSRVANVNAMGPIDVNQLHNVFSGGSTVTISQACTCYQQSHSKIPMLHLGCWFFGSWRGMRRGGMALTKPGVAASSQIG